MTPETARHTLIDAGLVLAHQGHGDMTRGHLSVRVPDQPDLFYMKAHSIGLDEITQDNILTIDMEGEVQAGTAKRHSEVYIHSEILRIRPDLNAVIHTHSTHLTALSATRLALQPLSQGGFVFAGALPMFCDTPELIRTKTLGAAVADTLGPNRAVLMKNHGIAITGRSLAEAVVLLVMLDEAARIELMVAAAGGSADAFPSEVIERLRDTLVEERQFKVNFDYLVRFAHRALRT
jgi:ribulose-5-phosphate 4-epimerase/fuculose-1-phosphate aldolase